jgi:fibronectin type 3 domain-containing protein
MLNSAVNLASTYTDSTVQDGQTYAYYVTSVDSSGIESTPSNIFNVTIP